ncbi:MAG TPA: prepilin-type N-terminal cleavage/methylation domain-containing protein [Nitrospirota bacterium]|nr:prepilin-type N-terminal cleavage/methylation domain-containing protein [Nitrospirota bacterium]
MNIFINRMYDLRRGIKDERGFSLVEVVVVVAIIGILAAISMESMDLVRRERVSSASKRLLGDLQGVRMDAMSTGPSGTMDAMQYIRGAGIRLVSSSQYVTFKFNDCNQDYIYSSTSCTGSTPEEYLSTTVTLPNNVQLFTAPTSTIVLFDHLGMAHKYDWTSLGGSPIVFVVQWPSLASYCINVSNNKIREGSWDGTTCNEK